MSGLSEFCSMRCGVTKLPKPKVLSNGFTVAENNKCRRTGGIYSVEWFQNSTGFGKKLVDFIFYAAVILYRISPEIGSIVHKVESTHINLWTGMSVPGCAF